MECLFDDDWEDKNIDLSFKKKKTDIDLNQLKNSFMPIYGKYYSIIVEHLKKRSTLDDIKTFGGFKKNNKISREHFNLLLSVEDDIEDFLNWFLVNSQILLFREYEALRTIKRDQKPKSIFREKYHQTFNYKAYLNKVETSKNTKKKYLCPFHKEKTPSMVYYKKSGNFHCHGCGIHLNFVGFLQTVFLLKEKEAIWLLCEYKKQKHFKQQISPKRNMALKIWKPILF